MTAKKELRQTFAYDEEFMVFAKQDGVFQYFIIKIFLQPTVVVFFFAVQTLDLLHHTTGLKCNIRNGRLDQAEAKPRL